MVDTSSGRRAKPFNLLWDEWEATKQPVQERGTLFDVEPSDSIIQNLFSLPRIANQIAPVATYEDGSKHLAWPSLLAMAPEGFALGQALSGHDIAANPEIGIPAAVDVAGGAMTGGFAATAAGAGERGALMANGLSRSSPAAARELDDLGFYSKALESAKAIPQQSGTPEQMISMLRKAGTKEGEIEATGLRQAFAGRQSVSRQEVEDYLRANRVRVKRTDDPKSFKSYTFLGNDDYNAAILSLDGSNNVRGHSGHFNVPNTVGHVMSTMTRTSDGQQVYLADQVQSDWGQTLRKFNGNPSAIEAKRAGLQSQYDELSAKANAADPEIVKLHGELADAYDKMQPGWFRSQSSRDSAALRHSIISQQIREIESQYSDDMSRVAQELANLSQKPDPHPLVNTTDQWLNTTLRHAVKDATDKGADYFALPTGDTVLSYNPGEEIGMNAFYNDIVKKNLTNIMSDLAGEKITPTTEKNLGGKFGGEFNMFPLNEAVKESVRSGLPLFSNSNPSTSLALELAKDAANVPAQKGFTAYHGSPHDFDKFDMSKIGTGEGAQAYGHGLYFAENEGVARSYRNKLSAPPGQFDWMSMGNSKKYRFEALPGDGTPKFLDNNAISDLLSDPQYLKDIHNVSKFGVDSLRNDIAELERKRDAAMASAPEQSKAYYAEDYGRRIENKKRDLAREEGQAAELDALVRGGTKLKQGSMYEVRINADPNDFLDWDKPLSQQSEKVRGAIEAMGDKALLAKSGAKYNQFDPFTEIKGGDFINSLNRHAGSPYAARMAFDEQGIPGVKYLDGNSRTAGDGSRNYVLFRDDIIDIVKKYGVAYAAMMYGEEAVNSAMGTGAAASPGQTDY